MLELHIQYPTVAALSADSPTPVGLAAQGTTLRGQDADIAAAEQATAAANQAAQYASETAADIRRRADAGEFDGKDGYTPQKGVDYFDGKDGQNGVDGKDGVNGKDGKTPVKGVDYFTPSEVTEFKKAVTPVKGIDYFDGQDGKQGPEGKQGPQGKPGYTPVEGVDYFTAEEQSDFVSQILNQFPGQSMSQATRATYDANTRTITPIYNQWYTNLGNPSLFEVASLPMEFGCKSDFTERNRVLYETSDDLGQTWTELNVSDYVHETLWGGTYQGVLSINKFVNPDDENSNPKYFRFTLDAKDYCFLNLLYMYTSGGGGRYHVKYEKRNKSTQEWTTQYETSSNDYVGLNWPGHSVIYHNSIPFAQYSGSNYYDQVRVTINHIPDYRQSLNYKTFTIYKIKFYGGYPMQEDVNGIKIDGHDKTFEFPAGIRLGNTKITEEQLKKLLALI